LAVSGGAADPPELTVAELEHGIAGAVIAEILPGASDAVASDGACEQVQSGTIAGETLHLEGRAIGLNGVVAAAITAPPAIEALGWGCSGWFGCWVGPQPAK